MQPTVVLHYTNMANDLLDRLKPFAPDLDSFYGDVAIAADGVRNLRKRETSLQVLFVNIGHKICV